MVITCRNEWSKWLNYIWVNSLPSLEDKIKILAVLIFFLIMIPNYDGNAMGSAIWRIGGSVVSLTTVATPHVEQQKEQQQHAMGSTAIQQFLGLSLGYNQWGVLQVLCWFPPSLQVCFHVRKNKWLKIHRVRLICHLRWDAIPFKRLWRFLYIHIFSTFFNGIISFYTITHTAHVETYSFTHPLWMWLLLKNKQWKEKYALCVWHYLYSSFRNYL